MKKILLLLLFPVSLFGQGLYVPAKTILGTVNGYTRPIAGATITVCAASTGGIPCAPALANTVFQDAGMNVPLSNPLFADSSGNYPQFAVAPGSYTITESAAGYTGFSYQVQTSCVPGGACALASLTVTNGGSLNGTFLGNPTFSGNVSVGGTLGAKHIDTLSDCSNSAFANTAACQTDASTTGGMFFPPNYSIGAFTNSSNRPVFNMTKPDWRGYIDVIDFGAKGDGSTDDTTAIQAAINFVCTGSSTTAPTANLCPNAISGNAVGGTVYIPAGDFHYSSPILVYGGITLRGAGKLATKLTKTTNTVGSGSITAGTGVGRSPTACSGGTCVDSFAVDSLISVPYISSGATDYAYRWSISDLAMYGSGTNGTKYGIYAPRSAQAEMRNLYIFMNCTKGAPVNCGSVQGNGFWTEDSWLMRHEGVTVDSSYIGWNHVNDGSSLGAGTSGIFADDWGVNIGCSGFHFFGLSYSSMIASAIDNYNKQSVDLANTDVTCAPYSFNTVAGMSINGGGAENLNGAVMYAAASSVSVSGGFKTFGQTGYTSAGTLASLFIDSAATVTFNGTSFSAVTSPGNLLNIVLQGGSTLIDTNSTLPSGGSTFIGYGGGSLKTDSNISGITLTNGTDSVSLSPAGLNMSAAPATTGLRVPVAAGAVPTVSGQIAYDSTANNYVGGVNGATQKMPYIVANGTKALNTASITTATCDAGAAVTATGTLTTDAVDWSFNAAPTATNKYGAFLVVYAVPTANTVTFYTCNPSATTSTPTAMTVNWSVRRP